MIHPGGLGDVLLAVPAMSRLRSRFSNHRLLLCAQDQVAILLSAGGIIDEWISVQGRTCTDLFAGVDLATTQLEPWLNNCDLAIAWLEDISKTVGDSLKAGGANEVIVQSPFSPTLRAIHQCDRFLETINERPIQGAGKMRLVVSEVSRRLGQACLISAGLSLQQSLVIIHPGSGSSQKCVSAEILAAVVAALQISGAIPVILEGPADRDSVDALIQLCMNPPIVLRGLDVLTVAGVLNQAEIFVGQDSGITHLAGLLGVPTVALFGPTDPIRWAPRGPHVTVIQGACCRCYSWGDVVHCRDKPCLQISQDDLVTLCFQTLKERVSRQRISSSCLVTEHPLC